MRSLAALAAALLLPSAPPLPLGTAAFIGALLVFQAPAQAQSAEAVAKVAQAITVRIEGATQGSGVLVKREGNRYTVLTAWHVVSGQSKGEEMDIYTPDGQRHQLEQGSIKRLGEVDMAVLSFASSNPYEVATVGAKNSVSSGSSIYVSGYPLPTSAVPSRLFRFLDGRVIANATVAIPNGYQLLYSNPTLPGMSGGAVLNAQGQLVGIHGQGETDSKMSEQEGVAVKTGTNQAVSIAYYSQYYLGATSASSSAEAKTAEDYLAQANSIRPNGPESSKQILAILNKSLETKRLPEALAFRGALRYYFKDYQGATEDYEEYLAKANNGTSDVASMLELAHSYMYLRMHKKALLIYEKIILLASSCGQQCPSWLKDRWHEVLADSGWLKSQLKNFRAALIDYNMAIKTKPFHARGFAERGWVKIQMGLAREALVDLNMAIKLDESDGVVFANRGDLLFRLGKYKQACDDYKKSASLGRLEAQTYLSDADGGWCRNMP